MNDFVFKFSQRELKLKFLKYKNGLYAALSKEICGEI